MIKNGRGWPTWIGKNNEAGVFEITVPRISPILLVVEIHDNGCLVNQSPRDGAGVPIHNNLTFYM